MVTCIECGKIAVFKPESDYIYGPMYECECGASVGCHRGTTNALGTACGPETRQARIRVHSALYSLWAKDGVFSTRRQAYKWLQKQMNLSRNNCHIGLFNVAQCKEALKCIDSFSGGL
jgi:hypothetical protein